MMQYEPYRQHETSEDSNRNADDETNLSNPPRFRLSEVAEVRGESDFSLGPGLGCIDWSSLERLISFHGYLSTGVFVGLQMLALGRRLLSVEKNERIHVVCETRNCLPDAFQALAGSTIGNKGLIVRDTCKMAVTITRRMPPGETTPGVRVVLDAEKTGKFAKLHAWYMNTEKVPHGEVVEILGKVGDAVYSYEFMKVPIMGKRRKRVAICRICRESFIQMEDGDGYCLDCAKEKKRA